MLTNNQTNCSNKKQETVQKIELKSIGNKISNNPIKKKKQMAFLLIAT
jgi:hypothetical protein